MSMKDAGTILTVRSGFTVRTCSPAEATAKRCFQREISSPRWHLRVTASWTGREKPECLP